MVGAELKVDPHPKTLSTAAVDRTVVGLLDDYITDCKTEDTWSADNLSKCDFKKL
jgi:hypothetical protein